MYSILSSRYERFEKARKPIKNQEVTMAAGVLTMAAAQGMGMIQDLWQAELNRKAEKRGVGNSKELMDYQTRKQLEIWEKTGYGAQMRQMKAAGLNPALMYGMGGGGGQTTGSVGATASGIGSGSHMSAMAGMGMQMALLDAQKKNIEADTAKKQAETQKTAGVDTTKTASEIDLLRQGLDNERWKYEILKLEKAMLNIQVHKEGDTLDEQIDTIEYNTKIAARQLEIITADATISQATIQEKIKIVQAEAIGAVLRNEAARAGITLTNEQTRNLKEQIKIAWSNNLQGWKGLDQNAQKIAIEKFKAEIQAAYPSAWDVVGRSANEAIEGIIRSLSGRNSELYRKVEK